MAEDPTEPSTASEASEAPAKAAAPAPTKPAGKAPAKAESAVVRKRVVSKRVTPKGAPQGVKGAALKGTGGAKGSGDGEDLGYSKRYTPPTATYAQGPSPWWVPTLMFGLLIVGALVIMLNYMGVFGDAANIRLVIGLAFILGGIVTATQYR